MLEFYACLILSMVEYCLFTVQDQFSELSTHAQRGIDFYEKFAHFAKERAAIENEYASKLRYINTVKAATS